MAQHMIWIFVGGGLGSLLRFGFNKSLFWGYAGFPWATFLANLLACFILGVVIAFDEKANLETKWKLAIATGFCGGFSTFSTFGLESLTFIKKDEWVMLGLYIGASVVLGIFCVWAGKRIIN